MHIPLAATEQFAHYSGVKPGSASIFLRAVSYFLLSWSCSILETIFDIVSKNALRLPKRCLKDCQSVFYSKRTHTASPHCLTSWGGDVSDFNSTTSDFFIIFIPSLAVEAYSLTGSKEDWSLSSGLLGSEMPVSSTRNCLIALALCFWGEPSIWCRFIVAWKSLRLAGKS